MRAYKLLASGAVGRFSGFHWPTGFPGPWVEATPERCASGIHGCVVEDIPYWLDSELWEIELDGAERCGHKLVAVRGRLHRRVAEWDDDAARAFGRACVAAVAPLADSSATTRQYLGDAEVRAEGGLPAAAGFIAARIAELAAGQDAYEVERARQAAWLADRLGLSDAAR